MGELIGLILLLALLFILFYVVAAGVVILVGAVGWYLSYPILGVITVLLAAFPYVSYRRAVKRKRWYGTFWQEELDKVALVGIALLIIWGCALRDQLSALWDSVSPYVLR